jgi:predicted metal-dependent hydrolase
VNAIASGVALFNAQKYWEAHEAWEGRWLVAAGDEKLFLQGLIQLAAAYHHVQRGTSRPGGLRLFAKASAKLHKYRDGYLGVSFEAALETASGHVKSLEQMDEIAPDSWPKLQYN